MIQRQTTYCNNESHSFGQLMLMHAVPLQHSNKQCRYLIGYAKKLILTHTKSTAKSRRL